MVAASLFPVAAPRIEGAALRSREAKSGPPPPEGLCGRGGGGGGGLLVVMGGGILSILFDPVPDSQQTVPLVQELVLCKIFEGRVQSEDMDAGKQNPGHFPEFVGLLVGLGFDSSTFFVKQHLPFPGQDAVRSISSQSRAKNPVTHVPEQEPWSFLLSLMDGLLVGGLAGLLGELVVVASTGLLLFSRLGITSSGGNFPSNICFDTQHFMLVLQIPFMSKIASQKPDNLSATQTPGHFSKGWK